MDYEALRQAAEQATLASILVGLSAGFLFSFNPVALAAIPVSLGYVTRARAPREALGYGAMFIAGMLVAHAVLGLAAGFGGDGLQRLLGRQWGLVLGPLLIVLGAAWPGWIRLPIPAIALRAPRATGLWGASVLGAAFSVAVCPFCTPALVVLLGVAAAVGSPAFGATLLLAFALGRALPILIGATALGWLESLKPLAKWHRAFEIAGGVLLIASGLYMLNAYFLLIPALAV
jgi:cytochrome c-type biogenesis protein